MTPSYQRCESKWIYVGNDHLIDSSKISYIAKSPVTAEYKCIEIIFFNYDLIFVPFETKEERDEEFDRLEVLLVL